MTNECEWCERWPIADTFYCWGYARDLCGFCFPRDELTERVRRAVSKQYQRGEVSLQMWRRVRSLTG